MADWLLPTEDSLYLGDLLDKFKDRDFDAGSLFLNVPTNPIAGMIRFVRASSKFQEYNGATWDDKVLSLAGGGTGAATAADARTNLGLGTIAVQNANSVNITGGNLAGSGAGITNLNASSLASGTVALARLPANYPFVALDFAGSSLASLVTRSAGDLNSGTLPDARFPATLPALNGSLLTALNANALASGTVAPARLGSGSGGAVKFLREDSTWQDITVIKSIQAMFLNRNSTADFEDFVLGTALTDVNKAAVVSLNGTNGNGISGSVNSKVEISFPDVNHVRIRVDPSGATWGVRATMYIMEFA